MGAAAGAARLTLVGLQCGVVSAKKRTRMPRQPWVLPIWSNRPTRCRTASVPIPTAINAWLHVAGRGVHCS